MKVASLAVVACLASLVLAAPVATPRATQGLVVAHPPFSLEGATLQPIVGGVFLAGMKNQVVAFHVENAGDRTVERAVVAARFPEASGIRVLDPPIRLGAVEAGGRVLLGFRADFSQAGPGAHALALEIQDGAGKEVEVWNVPVMSMGAYGAATGDVGTGTISVTIPSVFGGTNPWSATSPTVIRSTVEYAEPFAGQFGPLAFSDDPAAHLEGGAWKWWKVGAAILGGAALAAGAVVVGAAAVAVCTGAAIAGGSGAVAAGSAAVATAGAVIAEKDEIDPIRWGQEHTMPAADERTLRELVEVRIKYLTEPVIGSPWSADVTWDYTRVTDGRAYSASITQRITNDIHTATGRSVAFDKRDVVAGEPIVVTAQVSKRPALAGDSAYAVLNVVGARSQRLVYAQALEDDGRSGDRVADDGTYAARVDTTRLPVDEPLLAYVYGYKLSKAERGLPPLQAAQHIGGTLLSAPASSGSAIVPDAVLTVQGRDTGVASSGRAPGSIGSLVATESDEECEASVNSITDIWEPWLRGVENPCPDQYVHTYGMGASAGGGSATVLMKDGLGVGSVTVWDTNFDDCTGPQGVPDGAPGDFDGDYDAGAGGAFFGYGPWALDPECWYSLNLHGDTVIVTDLVFGNTVRFVIGADDQSGPVKITDPNTGEVAGCMTDGSIAPGLDPDDCLTPVQIGQGNLGYCTGGGDGGYWVFLNGFFVQEGAGGLGNPPTTGTITAF